MLHLVLGWLWHSALAQFGIAGIILAGSIALFIYSPLPSIRHICVSVASVCLVFLFFGPKFYLEGINYEKARWTAAETRARQMGETARADALHDAAGSVRDPFDSDSN